MSDLDLSPLLQRLEEYQLQGRTALLPALHAAQQLYGYIPPAAAEAIGQALSVPLADVYGVVEFYSLFYSQPVGKTVIHVCNDPACALAGSEALFKQIRFQQEGNTAIGSPPSLTVEMAPCLGLCEHAPAVLIQGQPVARANRQTWQELVSGKGERPSSMLGGTVSILTANCGLGHTVELSEYLDLGGYQALRKALNMQPREVIEEIKAAGLVGRGGAAFPTGLKWETAANASGEVKYVVCNADEAEPGTFKDRVLLEDDPHSILEGMLIAAYAIGAQKGYIYIRGEYLLPYEAINKAVEDAREAGFLGSNILDSDFEFDIEIRRGAGAYICGEETALFESIEGKRGFPRLKPPFPTTHGLFGKPTVINNVETLANVPVIIRKGAAHYRKLGTEKSPGSKLFCLSGDVVRPGLYEIPFGLPFHHLLYDLAGGVRPGHHFQAALFGGAAGAFATPDHLNVRLTFEDLKEAGLPLGSGVITVFDETRDLRDICLRLARFFAEESCGKCYPCQMGTQRQFEIMERIARGEVQKDDWERLQDVGWTMTDSSLCGLGQTAASAILSAMKHFPHLFQPV
jgi:NADH-quinone oxidoreductase subunit F